MVDRFLPILSLIFSWVSLANTLIIHNDKVVVDEPSIVAKDIIQNKVVAIGKKAQANI